MQNKGVSGFSKGFNNGFSSKDSIIPTKLKQADSKEQNIESKIIESKNDEKKQGIIESKNKQRRLDLHTQENKEITEKIGFFNHTLKALDSLAKMSIFDDITLKKGFRIECIDMQDSIFFKIYKGNVLYLACAYLSVLDERAFAKMQAPLLHFTKCSEINNVNKDYLKVCVPSSNSFDYKVRSNGVDTRLFYEHPLKLCPICVSNLSKILSKKKNREIPASSIKHEDILSAIFKNVLKNIVL